MHDLLSPLRDDPLPPSKVDIDRAVRAGRRGARMRWAALGLLLMVGAGGLAVINPWGGEGGGQVAAPHDGWDPMRRWIQVGEVAGLQPSARTTARYWQTYELREPGESGATVKVTAYFPGGQPVISLAAGGAPQVFDPAAGEPAGQVGGAPAYWSARFETQDSVQVLAWRWRDSAWVIVTARQEGANADAARLRDLARSVAEAATIAEGPGVTMPFTVGPARGVRLVSTTVAYYPGDRAWTLLHFGTVDNPTPLLFRPDNHTLEVNVNTVDVLGDKGPAPGEVNGHPAQIDGSRVRVYNVEGFTVEVNGERALDVAKSVRVIPGAAHNEQLWTGTPLPAGH